MLGQQQQQLLLIIIADLEEKKESMARESTTCSLTELENTWITIIIVVDGVFCVNSHHDLI